MGARRIRSEKLKEHQYTEGYVRCLENKIEHKKKRVMLSKCGSK